MVQTVNGVFKRDVRKLCLLEEANEQWTVLEIEHYVNIVIVNN